MTQQDRRIVQSRRRLVVLTVVQTLVSILAFAGWLLVAPGRWPVVLVWAGFVLFIVALNGVSLFLNWRRASETVRPSKPLTLDHA